MIESQRHQIKLCKHCCRSSLFSLLLLAASIFCNQVLYQSLIVPKLEVIPKVPLLWWAQVYLPIVIAFLYVGIKLRNNTEIFMVGLLGAFLNSFYVLWCMYSLQPGYRNQPIIWSASYVFTPIVLRFIFYMGFFKVVSIFKSVTQKM